METLALLQCTVNLLERGESAFHGFLWSRLLTEALLSALFEDSDFKFNKEKLSRLAAGGRNKSLKRRSANSGFDGAPGPAHPCTKAQARSGIGETNQLSEVSCCESNNGSFLRATADQRQWNDFPLWIGLLLFWTDRCRSVVNNLQNLRQ